MKFSLAWGRVAAQNVTLKVATAILGVLVLVQLFVILSLASRDPLVIERGCVTRALALAANSHSQDEISAFLKETLPQRFDSDAAPRADYFSPEELSARDKEQNALRDKGMRERFLVGNITMSEKEILVSGDRLVAVGKIKSVLPLTIKVSVKQVPRTEANPYGLVLAEITDVGGGK
jgi:hypothetical protein